MRAMTGFGATRMAVNQDQGFKKIRKYPKSDTAKRRQEKNIAILHACQRKKQVCFVSFVSYLFCLILLESRGVVVWN